MRNLILFLLWMIFTMLLTFTIIGMMLFVADGWTDNRSNWMNIGYVLHQKLSSNSSVISFCIWILFTFILVCSIFGMLVFLPINDNKPSTWLIIGKNLTEKSIKE